MPTTVVAAEDDLVALVPRFVRVRGCPVRVELAVRVQDLAERQPDGGPGITAQPNAQHAGDVLARDRRAAHPLTSAGSRGEASRSRRTRGDLLGDQRARVGRQYLDGTESGGVTPAVSQSLSPIRRSTRSPSFGSLAVMRPVPASTNVARPRDGTAVRQVEDDLDEARQSGAVYLATIEEAHMTAESSVPDSPCPRRSDLRRSISVTSYAWYSTYSLNGVYRGTRARPVRSVPLTKRRYQPSADAYALARSTG